MDQKVGKIVFVGENMDYTLSFAKELHCPECPGKGQLETVHDRIGIYRCDRCSKRFAAGGKKYG